MLVCKASPLISHSLPKTLNPTPTKIPNKQPSLIISNAFQTRLSLVVALASQTSSLSQRLLMDLATETAKYVFPKRFESRNLEEALMAVPDLETVKYRVLSRTDLYEIRQVESYFIAETTMPGRTGFDFSGASQSFNVLADYLFEYNEGENGDDYTCYYTQGSIGWGENGNDNTCDNEEVTRSRKVADVICHARKVWC